jgi:predicted nuclease of predicted toxin-antitoxin system
VVLSKDSDLKASHLLQGKPKKLLKVNLGNLSTKKLISILEENLELCKEKFKKERCLIEINPDSIVIIEN